MWTLICVFVGSGGLLWGWWYYIYWVYIIIYIPSITSNMVDIIISTIFEVIRFSEGTAEWLTQQVCLHLKARTVLLKVSSLDQLLSAKPHYKCRIWGSIWKLVNPTSGVRAQVFGLTFIISSTIISTITVRYLNILLTEEAPIKPDRSLSLGGISGNSWVFSIQYV